MKWSWRVLHDEDFSIMPFQDCWVLKVRKLCCHLNFPIPVGALGIKCQGHWKFYPNTSLGCGTEDLTLDTSWIENAIMTFSWCYGSALSPFCTAEKKHFWAVRDWLKLGMYCPSHSFEGITLILLLRVVKDWEKQWLKPAHCKYKRHREAVAKA